VRTLLFECARELLFNVVKHAGVKEARVVMERSDDEVRVAVEDRGRGFDPALIQSVRLDSAGFGLFSVQQRIELLGGRTEIHSAPGQGTRITLVAPILAQRR
jgi:signal transduction histidine kinase